MSRVSNYLSRQSPRARFLRNSCKRSTKNAAKICRFSSKIFVLQFPGKMAANTFTNNPRHFHSAPNQVFFSLLQLWGLGGPTITSENSGESNSSNEGQTCFKDYVKIFWGTWNGMQGEGPERVWGDACNVLGSCQMTMWLGRHACRTKLPPKNFKSIRKTA